jgi:hypothetical protein
LFCCDGEKSLFREQIFRNIELQDHYTTIFDAVIKDNNFKMNDEAFEIWGKYTRFNFTPMKVLIYI